MNSVNAIPSLDLAYLGDAVLELLVREHLVRSGVTGSAVLNKKALSFVTAPSQSAALENILPHMTEEELAVFKRARNGHTPAAPKRATICEYRRATGFEALFAWLWLSDNKERAKELFDIAYNIAEK